MKAHHSNFVKLIWVVLISIVVVGCSSPKRVVVKQPAREKPSIMAPAPGAINVALRIEDWCVADHRVLDYNPEWGNFRFAGRFVYIDSLVFKFKSSKFPSDYWLAIIPQVERGQYEISALRYSEPSCDLKPINPPRSFTILLTIRNGKVINHMIKDPHPGWGYFYVDKYRGGVLYLKNAFYPESAWRSRMPQKDGNWTITAVLN